MLARPRIRGRHVALANKNHAALMYLLERDGEFSEWVTVVAFYKAVHLVDAALVNKLGRSGHGHADRLDRVKRLGDEHLHKHFRILWSASSIARYLFDGTGESEKKEYSSFSDYLPPDDVKKKIVDKRLYGVEYCAVGLLSDAGKDTLVRLPKGTH